jgi:transcriptional regulator with XRE-family HTH domain
MIANPALTGAQLRAARAMIRWTAEELASHAQVGVATIRRAEGIDGPIRGLASITHALRQTLESAGVEFIPEDSGGAGVRLRTRSDARSEDTRSSNQLTERS